jgi:AsmA-like protein
MDEPYIIYVDPPKQKKPLGKRILKKLLVWFGVAFGLLLLTSIIIAAFFEDEIGEKLISEINKEITTELEVEDFSLSLLSGFPNVSANLGNVTLKDSQKGNLVEAGTITFKLGFFSLFSSNIKVKSVKISNGAIYIKRDRKGQVNYEIFKKGETKKAVKSEPSDLGISIEESSFKAVELIYVDEKLNNEVSFLLDNAVVSGEFSAKQFSLSSFADIKSRFVDLEDKRYLVGKQIVYDANLEVDLEKGRYVFENVEVGVASNHFKLTGFVESKGVDSNFDLKIKGDDGNIESVIGFLPVDYQEYLKDFKSKGAFSLLTTIKGKLNNKETPAINATFGLTDGSISSEKLASALNNVTFTARFTNGKERQNKTSFFEISDFKGYFNRKLVNSSLSLSNFDDPKIDFLLNGSLPLASMYGLLNQSIITGGSGVIDIKDLKLRGRYKDMIRTSKIGRVETSGSIEFDDAGLTINGQEVIIEKGGLVIKDNSLLLSGLKINGPDTEINLGGKFLNFIPVLFADSINSQLAELRFEAELDAPNIDFDQLINMTESPVQEGQVAKAVFDSIQVAHTLKWAYYTNFLKGTFKTNIDNFNYNKIEGQNFKGTFDFDHNELTIEGNTNAMEGQFNVEGKAFFEEKPYVKAKVIADKINVQEFFRQAENFGQDVVESDHIKGKMDAMLTVDAFWDEEGNYDNKKLRVLGDISIKNGELVDFKMLYDFADFIKIKDLRHIKFTNMRNWLEIRNEKVYIPAMFIQNNALNMTVSGEHGFDNKIDYGIKVNGGQVLFAKFKKYNPNRPPQPSKKKGWLNIYYRIFGDVTDYEIVNDKRYVSKKFILSDSRKRDIQEALKLAFGNKIDLYDQPSDWNDEDNIPEYQDEEPGKDEFLDFEVGGGEEDEMMWEEDND